MMLKFPLALLLLVAVFITPLHAAERIVTLSPHLTEWVYSLGAEDRLVGVSAFSDYPLAASEKPVVADYQGVDFTALMALEPDLVLAWGGGNKPQDITRLKSLGLQVYVSQPQTLDDIAREMTEVAELTGTLATSRQQIAHYRDELALIRQRYQQRSVVRVFYYMWSQPLMTIGQGAWANKLLDSCGAESVFIDSPIDYPQVAVKQVLMRQPELLVATPDQPLQVLEQFWAPHRSFIKAPLIKANAHALHRFTLRIIASLNTLCENIDAHRTRQQP